MSIVDRSVLIWKFRAPIGKYDDCRTFNSARFSAIRARQLLAGTILVEVALDVFDRILNLARCSWGLRKGVILRRLRLAGFMSADRERT